MHFSRSGRHSAAHRMVRQRGQVRSILRKRVRADE
jgi:hypothetical protein